MVMALLTVLLVQISTGLFSADVDSYLYDAPLAHHLTADNAARVSAVHQGMIYALLALVLIHVLAIFAYRLFKGKNLVLPMFSGNKQLSVHLPPPAIASWRRACACAGLAGTVVLGLVLGWH
jgi:cytochrome b